MTAFECNRLLNRRAAITSVARKLFIEQGYERTTLGDVVERSGGSLATVYKLFGNKEGLLNAVVLENAASGDTLIRQIAATNAPPNVAIHRIASALKDHFLDPDLVALIRIVMARSISDVDVARSYYEETADRTRAAMQAVFQRWADEGYKMNANPALLTDCFLGMLFSDVYRAVITHYAAPPLTPDEFRTRTNLFLKGAGLAEPSDTPVST